ncbi:MAG: chloride channel protein [Sphingomonas sp.]
MQRRLRILRRARSLLRRHGPGALVWRRRIAILGGAITIGLAALVFARAADWAGEQFLGFEKRWWWAPLIATPIGFAVLTWLTRLLAPSASGSGIPQVMAASRDPESGMADLVSARTVTTKMLLTIGALLLGASVGREGPTVQVSASIMGYAHRLMSIPLRASVLIAGGAAGVAAAFNTLLAGVAFAGLVGGVAGGLFSRLMLAAGKTEIAPMRWLRTRPIMFATLCGGVVAVLGVTTTMTWGTGYQAANALISGADVPIWFGAAKFVTTLATAVSGLPGGIFAPSLSVGAGIGDMVRTLLPGYPPGAIVLLGMVAYFTGVVRAPLTAVIIIVETTASRGLMLPLVAAALVAEFAAQLVCKQRLYHGLSQRYALPASAPATDHERFPKTDDQAALDADRDQPNRR